MIPGKLLEILDANLECVFIFLGLGSIDFGTFKGLTSKVVRITVLCFALSEGTMSFHLCIQSICFLIAQKYSLKNFGK